METVKTIKWEEIEAQYVAGDMTLRKLAEMNGISASKCFSHSKECGWSAKRKAYRVRVAVEAIRIAEISDADDLARVLDGVRILRDKAVEMLETDEKQLFRYVVDEGCDGIKEYNEKIFRKMDTKAFAEIGRGLESITRLFQSIKRIPTLRDERELERLKLDIDRDRREAAREAEDNSRTVQVVLSQEVKELLPDE